MKNPENSAKNDSPTSSPWDDLKNQKFAGENHGRAVKYNEKFIEDFGRDNLREVLKNPESLKIISADYLKQYAPNSDSNAKNLAGKESLDHFVLERLSSDHPEMLIKSQEFKNYADYIAKIANDKKFISKDGKETLYPEYFTNPVLKDPKNRELILKTAYPNGDLAKMNTWINKEETKYKGRLKNWVEKGIEKEQKLSQDQMDIIGDYIYSSKNFNNGIAKKYAEYCLNEIKPEYNLKASTPMLGALTNYFVHEYQIDRDVQKNSRFIIANRTDTPNFHAGVSTSYGCVLEQNYFKDISLISDDSLNVSRTYKEENRDIYCLMMVSFHELTHDHQRNLVKKGDKISSSMMYALREILKKEGGCYTSKTGEKGNYYQANHDDDETEIDADEESWRECRSFIANHQKVYAWDHHDSALEKKTQERIFKCMDNEKAVRTRRTFGRKLKNTGEQYSAIKYDVEGLKSAVKISPDILKTYPQFSDYIDEQGELKPQIFLSSKIGKREWNNGISSRDDVFGTEIGTYILTDDREAQKLTEYIKAHSQSLTSAQTENLIGNLYNIIHQTVDKSRDLKDFDPTQYEETNARGKNFNMSEKKRAILKQYLTQARHALSITSVLKSTHPELKDRLEHEESVYITSYYRELSEGLA